MRWTLPGGRTAVHDGTWWTLYCGRGGVELHTEDPEAFAAYLVERGLCG